MPRTKKLALKSNQASSAPTEQYVRVRIRAMEIPPIKDGIVIGRSAPIGSEAMMRTLKLMSNERFVHITFNDDIVSDAIVRESILRKLKSEKLKSFILTRIRPLMAENELLLLDMEIEVVVEDTL